MTLKITRQSLLDGTLKARQQHYASIQPSSHWRTEAKMDASLGEILRRHNTADDLWVFGYGSLIWNPAFEFAERRLALLHGWHRRFCLKMTFARGTPEAPGLMLALDHGGTCNGVAFRIAAKKVRGELEILWQREMYGGAYNARWVCLKIMEGIKKPAVTFVANRANPRYLKNLSVAQTATLIATAQGDLGTSREYLESTVEHLRELGLRDAGLARIVAALPKC